MHDHWNGQQPGTAAADTASAETMPPPAIAFEHVALSFDDAVVLRDVSFTVRAGDMAVLIGPSGGGKSVILKLVLGLLEPDAGCIRVHGRRIDDLDERDLTAVRDEIGMLFQEGALFDSLTVGENVGFKLEDDGRLDAASIRARVAEVLGFVGLEPYVDRLPSALSGGQRRRVAIARALAARPRLVLLDEPTSGLDPITAKTVDAEIIKLRDLHDVSALVVTHQLQDAFYVATHEARNDRGRVTIGPRAPARAARAHFLLLRDGIIAFDGQLQELLASPDPYTTTYLSGWIPPLTLQAPETVPCER